MLRKKKKSRHKMPIIENNVVSLMDVLTTLLFFLLVLTTVSELYIVPASALTAAATKTQVKKPAFALQLIVLDPKSAYVYLGAVENLSRNQPELLRDYLSKRFSGNEQTGYYRKLEASNSRDLLERLQDILVVLKRHFPKETRSVVAFTDVIDYQLMVDTLSRVRSLSQLRPAVQTTANQQTEVLFPQVTVSEWSGSGNS